LLQSLELPMEYGVNYLCLGYLPGEESALRLLVGGFTNAFILDYTHQQRLDSYPLSQGLSFSKIQRVIVLSEDAISVQHWVEQVQSATLVPMDALVSASAVPFLSPYYYSHQLRSLTGGLPAALEYSAYQQGVPLDLGFSFGLAGLAILVVFVAIVATIRNLR